MPRLEINNRTRGKQNGRKFLSCFIYVLTRVEVCAWGSVRNGERGFGGLVSPFSLLALIFHGLWFNHIFSNVVPSNFVEVLQQEAWNQWAWFWCNPNTETISLLIFILSITCIRKSVTNLWIIWWFWQILYFHIAFTFWLENTTVNTIFILITINIILIDKCHP